MTSPHRADRARPSTLLRSLLLAVAAGSLLSACAPLLIGGAIWGGSLVVTDRRTSGTQIDDQGIELKSGRRITDVIADRGHVNVTSYNRLVLITGEVPTEADMPASSRPLRASRTCAR